MTLRGKLKFLLYGSCPGLSGSFPYYGEKIFFPKGSFSFKAACQQGVYEADCVALLTALIEPGSFLFDIGANIGLMAIPVLNAEPTCKVVSFEPSPNVLPSLRRTVAASSFADRWTLVEKAVGKSSGFVSFALSSAANSLFDGLRPTGRVPSVGEIEVGMTTLDQTWRSLGRPRVSIVKVDVEGAEFGVLSGAFECIESEHPFILTELNSKNLKAYECQPDYILRFAVRYGYELIAVPGLQKVTCESDLKLHMAFTENFLLAPKAMPL